MKILMFSNDSNILIDGTAAERRMRSYAQLFDELHIVVLTAVASPDRAIKNLFCYPAAARYALIRRVRAWGIAHALAKNIPFTLISAQGPDELGLVGYVLSRRLNIPLQLQVHTDVFSPWYRRGSVLNRARYLLAQFLLSRAQCVRVVSERIKRSMNESQIANRFTHSVVYGDLRVHPPKSKDFCGKSQIMVLPIYTDTVKFFAATADPETEARFQDYDMRMIAVGRFVEKEKNFLMLIEVMRTLVRQHPHALLVIAGEGPARAKYESRIANYRLERNVFLEPWRDDLPSFYKSFDLFLLSSNYEGWGRVVIEAMSVGLCVVMTAVGLAGEVVRSGENGIVVPVGDGAAFLRAIEELYSDEEKRKRLAAAARETIRQLKPQTEAEYLALYKETFMACRIT